jgi:iron complex outermembrane receptor protein
MKNGFTWQGFEADLRGGSFGRAQASFQYGKQVGDFSTYIAGKEISDGGWRVDGASQISRVYGDVGYKANGAEVHFNVTAANNMFGAAASTPVQLLQQNWSSV